MARDRCVLIVTAWLLLLTAGAQGQYVEDVASAEEHEGASWLFVNEEGDVRKTSTPSDEKIHSHGFFSFDTADYFRGLYDGVEEDCDDVGFHISPAWTVEMPENSLFTEWSLTLGINNGLSDPDPAPNADSPEIWYEADPYLGAAVQLGGGFLAGLTYTAYTSPNSFFQTRQELALAVGYAGDDVLGRIGPQGKLAADLEDGDFYAEVGVMPRIGPWDELDMVFGVPVKVGLGFDEYYADDADSAAFASVGLTTSIPIQWIPDDYGNWNLDIGAFVIMRESDLVDAGKPIDDGNNCILMGTVGISWAL